MINPILTLILAPFVAGLALLIRIKTVRKLVVGIAALAVAIVCIRLTFYHTPGPIPNPPVDHHWLNFGILAIEMAMAAFVVYVGVKARNYLIVGLMVAQSGLMAWFEITQSRHLFAAHDLVLDKFSIIMAFINGVIGGGICVYALGYMRDYYKAHPDLPDRRPVFFSLLFVFMGAMFGLIFSNNLLWLFFFWEITTLCSFLLIGFTQTEEARRNARLALVMNLAGGLAFAIAIVWFFFHPAPGKAGSIEFSELLVSDRNLVMLPVAMLALAGITKSAQLPFSSWLLGAMVAPTPVSALLHSSTMVKAGVYLVLRLSPLLSDTYVGMLVALVGAITFVLTSFAAISTSDSKRVLALSTVANLGLVVLCAGLGTHEALWAGIMLIIFHAVAKCLMFCTVGVVENKIRSRDIESMTGLIVKMPRTAVMMLIGMAGMFLAPFGMLISKYAVLKAIVDAYPVLAIFIAFGSAATLFFWVKWMGKLLEVIGEPAAFAREANWMEYVALVGLSVGTFFVCVLFPVLSRQFIEPHVRSIYAVSESPLSQGNIIIMSIMMSMILMFPLNFLGYGRGVKVTEAYLGGANLGSSVRFEGSAGEVASAATGNYYLRDLFNESFLLRWGIISCAILLISMVVFACL